MWWVRDSGTEDLSAIEDLVALVDGDGEDLQASQFVVAEDEGGGILGCARLRPYQGFLELASVAVRDGLRTRGVGREMVITAPSTWFARTGRWGFFAGSTSD